MNATETLLLPDTQSLPDARALPIQKVGIKNLLDYQAGLGIRMNAEGRTQVTVTLTAPVTSLCPCSKKISDYGAHNQRSHITVAADVVVGELAFEDGRFTVASENFESIHNHSAYAQIEGFGAARCD